MLKLLIDERDLRNQMDYLRSLDNSDHEVKQMHSREVKQLQWVMNTSKKLNLDLYKRIIDKQQLEETICYYHGLNLNTKDETKIKINEARIAQIQWCINNSEPIWEEEAIKKSSPIVAHYIETEKWSWTKFGFITQRHYITK